MTHFAKGNKGRPKGSKNKTSLGRVDWTPEDKKKIKEGIIYLIEKKNPTILGKLLDYYLRVENPDAFMDNNVKVIIK